MKKWPIESIHFVNSRAVDEVTVSLISNVLRQIVDNDLDLFRRIKVELVDVLTFG